MNPWGRSSPQIYWSSAGGIGGLAAAITAKETSPDVDVLVVDKACPGWSGKANKGGGNISYVEPEDGVDNFVAYHVRNIGYFLEDQELLRAYGEESRGNLDRLESWGVHIYRHEDGSPKVRPLDRRSSMENGCHGPGRHLEHAAARNQAGHQVHRQGGNRRLAPGRATV